MRWLEVNAICPMCTPHVVVVVYSTQNLAPENFKETLNILRCERVTQAGDSLNGSAWLRNLAASARTEVSPEWKVRGC